MFDSGILVKDLIDELKNTEVDIALDIPNATYVSWLNSLQRLLYTEVIKEQRKLNLSVGNSTTVPLTNIVVNSNEEELPRFEDVYTIYTKEGTQLIKTTLASGSIFSNCFYKDGTDIGFNATPDTSQLTVVYIVRPALINVNTYETDNTHVMLPVEFIELAKSKLRGEAYKLVNEDGIAAKWLNDYNVLLETFKAWIATKSANFGI